MDNKISNSVVTDALLEIKEIEETIKENTANVAKKILDESFNNAISNLINEADGNDVKVEEDEVEDTEVTKTKTKVKSGEKGAEESIEIDDEETEDAEGDFYEEIEADMESDFDLDDYKVGDNTYDLSNADNDEVVKVWKRMKGDECVEVIQDGDTIDIVDNETGAEYSIDYPDGITEKKSYCSNELYEIDLGELGDITPETEFEDEEEYEEDDNNMILNDMDEYNEYEADFDDEIPMDEGGVTRTKRELKHISKLNTAQKGMYGVRSDSVRDGGQKVMSESEEDFVIEYDDEEPMDEGGVTRTKRELKHISKKNSAQRDLAGIRSADVRDGAKLVAKNAANEMRYRLNGLLKEVKTIQKENVELKKALGLVRTSLKEANLINNKLGHMSNLLYSRTTTVNEKKNIIDTFDKAKTVNEVKNVYHSLNNSLKKREIMKEEKKNPVNNVNKENFLNERTIYVSKELEDINDLLRRVDKIR